MVGAPADDAPMLRLVPGHGYGFETAAALLPRHHRQHKLEIHPLQEKHTAGPTDVPAAGAAVENYIFAQ